MEIGMLIKARREELHMSQEDLAKKTGYKSRSSINKIEVDGRGLPHSKLVAFAKALETTPAYLMGWGDESVKRSVNGLEGLMAILADIYGYAKDESVHGTYSDSCYYQIGSSDDSFAISESDFDQLYESVKTTIQQFVSFIKQDTEKEYQSCLEAANTPPDKELYAKLREDGIIYPDLEEKYGYNSPSQIDSSDNDCVDTNEKARQIAK